MADEWGVAKVSKEDDWGTAKVSRSRGAGGALRDPAPQNILDVLPTAGVPAGYAPGLVQATEGGPGQSNLLADLALSTGAMMVEKMGGKIDLLSPDATAPASAPINTGNLLMDAALRAIAPRAADLVGQGLTGAGDLIAQTEPVLGPAAGITGRGLEAAAQPFVDVREQARVLEDARRVAAGLPTIAQENADSFATDAARVASEYAQSSRDRISPAQGFSEREFSAGTSGDIGDTLAFLADPRNLETNVRATLPSVASSLVDVAGAGAAGRLAGLGRTGQTAAGVSAATVDATEINARMAAQKVLQEGGTEDEARQAYDTALALGIPANAAIMGAATRAGLNPLDEAIAGGRGAPAVASSAESGAKRFLQNAGTRGKVAAGDALKEAAGEFPQGASDQIIANLATGTPAFDQVANQGLVEAAAGGPVAAATSLATQQLAPPEADAATKAQRVAQAAQDAQAGMDTQAWRRRAESEPIPSASKPRMRPTEDGGWGPATIVPEAEVSPAAAAPGERNAPQDDGAAPANLEQAVAAEAPRPQAAQPIDPADPLSPRAPAPAALEPGVTRDQIMGEIALAQTEDQRSTAAARLAAFNAQEAPRGTPEGQERPRQEAQQEGQGAPAPRPAPAAQGATRLSDVGQAKTTRRFGIAANGTSVVARAEDIAPDVAARNDLANNSDAEGFFDEATGQVYVIDKNLDVSRGWTIDGRRAWVVAHEGGHRALRAYANDVAKQAGPMAQPARELATILDRAGQNDTISMIARRIAGSTERATEGLDSNRATDEALAEAMAAVVNDNYSELEARYRVQIPQAMRNTLRGYVTRLVEKVRNLFRASGSEVSDTEIYELLTQMRKRFEDGRVEGLAKPAQRQQAEPVDEEEGGAPITASKRQTSREHDFEVSTRSPSAKPTAKFTPEDPKSGLLISDFAAGRGQEKWLSAVTGLVEAYPNYRPSQRAVTPEQKIERLVKHMVDNLLWLHDQVPAKIRERSKLWYDGANAIANRWANKYEITDAQAAGILAVLSPQKDWFMNVSLASRVADVMTERQSFLWSSKMSETADRIFAGDAYAEDLAEIRGKSLKNIDDEYLKGMWVRVYDQAHNPSTFWIVSPEGDFIAEAKKKNGDLGKVAWGGISTIAKAVSIFEDGSSDNISKALGLKHKVRNFYNNILVPNSRNGHVTIDTHAVAAALLRALSGNSLEVMHNFGGPKSAHAGLEGTYPLYEEAYRRAAEARGILPREMQSITWEAIRGMYVPTFKSQASNVDSVDAVWTKYKKGRITHEQAQQEVLSLSGGIDAPGWSGRDPGAYVEDESTADAGGVSSDGVSGRDSADDAGAAGQRPGAAPRITASRRATINVGLDIPGGGRLTHAEVKAAVTGAGAKIISANQHRSDSEDTLVIEIEPPLTPEAMDSLSVSLRQEAIPQRMEDGSGELYGPKAEDWGPYNPSYFLMPDGSRADQITTSRRAITETPEFKRWFGDSKVVDAKGKPLVVYHGTLSSFDAFDRKRATNGLLGAGFYFTSSSADAGNYADASVLPSVPEDAAGNIIPAYLSIKNPLIADGPKATRFAGGDLERFIAAFRQAAKEFPTVPASGVSYMADERFPADARRKPLALENLVGLVMSQLGMNDWGMFSTPPPGVPSKMLLLQRALELAGYDGVVFNGVKKRFGGKMNGVGNSTKHYVAFRPEQIKSAIGNSGAFGPANPSIIASRRTPAQAAAQRTGLLSRLAASGFPLGSPTQGPNGQFSKLTDTVDRVREELQDKMLRARRLTESVTTQEVEDFYTLENMMFGKARDTLEQYERDYILKLQNGMKRLGVSMEQMSDYLLARHAEERNRRIASINPLMPDAGSGITTADAQGVLAGNVAGPYSGKVLSADVRRNAAALAKLIDGMRDETLKMLVASDRITPQLEQTLRGTYKHYVPLRGKEDIEPWMEFGPSRGRGLNVGSTGIQRAGGRGAGNLPLNIVGEIVGDLQRAAVNAGKAEVLQSFLKFAMAHPMPGVYTVEPVDLEWKFDKNTGEAYLGVKRAAEDDHRAVLVPYKGSAVRIRFEDERLARAMTNLGQEDFAGFVKWFGKINRWRSAVLTRYNPGFAPVNIVRDAIFGLTAITAEQGAKVAAETVINYGPAFTALLQDSYSRTGDSSVPDAQKTMADWAVEYAEQGVKTGMTMTDDVVDLQKRLSVASTTLMQLAASGKPITAIKESVVRAGTPIVDAIEHFNDASENAIRLAAYVAMRQRGDTKQAAAKYAKNVTINFNRKGFAGPAVNAIFLFYNAAMQGSHAVFRVMKKPAVAGFLAGLAGLQYMAALSMMGDDDDDGVTEWDKVPKYVRETSLVIPLYGSGGKSWVSIPMPYGFNLVTYGAGRIAQWAEQGARPTDSGLFTDMVTAGIGAFSPVPLGDYRSMFGDTIGFAMSMASNKDDLGRPIAKQNQWEQYDTPNALEGKATTPRVFVSLSQMLAKLGGADLEERKPPVGWLDVAPEQLEQIYGFASGGLGNIASKSVRWWEQYDAEGMKEPLDYVTAAPIASRFVGQAGGATEARAIAERYYGEAGEFQRNLDVMNDKIVKGEDPEAVLAERQEAVPALRGVELARYRRPAKPSRTMRGGDAGDLKISNAGKVQFTPGTDAALGSLKDAKKTVEDLNGAINSLRGEDLTIGQALSVVGGADLSINAEEVLGLEPGYNADRLAPTRVRTRAIKLLQEQRQKAQQQFLIDLEDSRE